MKRGGGGGGEGRLQPNHSSRQCKPAVATSDENTIVDNTIIRRERVEWKPVSNKFRFVDNTLEGTPGLQQTPSDVVVHRTTNRLQQDPPVMFVVHRTTNRLQQTPQ